MSSPTQLRLSDWWLREEDKKCKQRLRIGISIDPLTDGYSSTPAISHYFFPQFRAKKFLTKNWHGRTLVGLWTFLAYVLAL